MAADIFAQQDECQRDSTTDSQSDRRRSGANRCHTLQRARPYPVRQRNESVVFGDFMVPSAQEEDRPAVMLTIVDYSRRHRGSVAVCLFGSMDNFPGYIQESGPRTERWGWVSSEARSVFRFLKSHQGDPDSTPSPDTPGEMAAPSTAAIPPASRLPPRSRL